MSRTDCALHTSPSFVANQQTKLTLQAFFRLARFRRAQPCWSLCSPWKVECALFSPIYVRSFLLERQSNIATSEFFSLFCYFIFILLLLVPLTYGSNVIAIKCLALLSLVSNDCNSTRQILIIMSRKLLEINLRA